MAVSIDTVYQKVLAIANKEQRGYITPQEFNLFADQVQMDIFEQYFYDINQYSRIPGNSTEYSDVISLIEEKLSLFKTQTSLQKNGAVFTKKPNIYRIGTILHKGREVQRVNYNELIEMSKSPLVKPSQSYPVFYERSDGYLIRPNTITSRVACTFIKKPEAVNWGYSIVGDHALYDSTTSQDFQLHHSEENNLIIKILALAGIAMEDQGLYQTAAAEDNKNIQQEKS
jgi:hypothetical protein